MQYLWSLKIRSYPGGEKYPNLLKCDLKLLKIFTFVAIEDLFRDRFIMSPDPKSIPKYILLDTVLFDWNSFSFLNRYARLHLTIKYTFVF